MPIAVPSVRRLSGFNGSALLQHLVDQALILIQHPAFGQKRVPDGIDQGAVDLDQLPPIETSSRARITPRVAPTAMSPISISRRRDLREKSARIASAAGLPRCTPAEGAPAEIMKREIVVITGRDGLEVSPRATPRHSASAWSGSRRLRGHPLSHPQVHGLIGPLRRQDVIGRTGRPEGEGGMEITFGILIARLGDHRHGGDARYLSGRGDRALMRTRHGTRTRPGSASQIAFPI